VHGVFPSSNKNTASAQRFQIHQASIRDSREGGAKLPSRYEL